MFLPEVEAKKKECPFLGGQCKGRACMAWKPADASDRENPFRAAACAEIYRDANGEKCDGNCRRCKYGPGCCALIYPETPIQRARRGS